MHDRTAVTEEFWDAAPEAITEDILSRHDRIGPGFWLAVIVTAILFVVGIAGLFLRLQGGFQDRGAWGYYAATFAYLFTIMTGAPMVAIGLLFTKAHMRRPVAALSALFAIPAILVFLLFIPILSLIPPAEGRQSLWMGIPIGGGPHMWDTLSLGGLVVCGAVFFWLMSRPDLQIAGHAGRRSRRTRIAGALAGRWRGSHVQWWLMKRWLAVLGFLYFVGLVLTHTLISTDVAMSLVPGWRSAIFAPYHILTALQGGVAATILAMAILRWTGYRSYLLLDQFWGLGKIMFSIGLLGIYFTFADLVTLWYGRTPTERALLELLMFGANLPLFLGGFFFSFFGPLLAMIWNQVRQSILGPTLVATMVLLGLLMDRIRIYAAAFNVSQVSDHAILEVPPARPPDGADIMLIVGLPAGAILFYLLAAKLFPAMSIWQIKELLPLRTTRRFHQARVVTMGKPE